MFRKRRDRKGGNSLRGLVLSFPARKLSRIISSPSSLSPLPSHSPLVPPPLPPPPDSTYQPPRCSRGGSSSPSSPSSTRAGPRRGTPSAPAPARPPRGPRAPPPRPRSTASWSGSCGRRRRGGTYGRDPLASSLSPAAGG
jgi:hypothetical protein